MAGLDHPGERWDEFCKQVRGGHTGFLDQMTPVSIAIFKTLIAAYFLCAEIAHLLKQNVYLIKRQYSVSSYQSISTQDLEGRSTIHSQTPLRESRKQVSEIRLS